jgi:hypothetical protein
MIERQQYIGRMKLTGDPKKDIPALHDVTARLEQFLCEKIPSDSAGGASADLTALKAQVNNLTTIIEGLQLVTFPGFGTDHNTAAYGDHQHAQNTFFTKQGSQDAVLGINPIVFDPTYLYASPPNVLCWLQQSDGSFSPLVVQEADITINGFTVNVSNIDGSPKLKYHAIGS